MKDKGTKNKKYYLLKKPSIFKRTYKTIIYNVFFTVLFFVLFRSLYTLDDLAFELDYFLMWGLEDFRYQLLIVAFLFFMLARQILKDCNLIKFMLKSCEYEKECVKLGYKRTIEGTEGTGKTFTMLNTALVQACDNNEKLMIKYFTMYPFESQLANDVDYNVIKSSVEYYEKHPEKIPNLMTNIKIEYDKRTSYVYDKGIIEQDKRPPESLVICLTEMAIELPNSLSKAPPPNKKDPNKVNVKSDFFSKSRQMADTYIFGDEQRTGEIMLQFRSVVSSNRIITVRKKVLKPRLLEFLEERLGKRVLEKQLKTSKLLSKLYNFVKMQSRDIGFYLFEYNDKEAIKDATKQKRQYYVIPCDLPFDYDTREMRNTYRLYNQPPTDFTTT